MPAPIPAPSRPSPDPLRSPTPKRTPAATVLLPTRSGFMPDRVQAGDEPVSFEALVSVRIDHGGGATWSPAPPQPPRGSASGPPLETLRSVLQTPRSALPGNAWAGWISYDAAQSIEPDRLTLRPDPALPAVELHRVDLDRSHRPLAPAPAPAPAILRSRTGGPAYRAAVARALEYIRAGDVYQVNLAHQLAGRFSGDAADLFAHLCRGARPAHGLGLISPAPEPVAGASRGPSLAVLSLSPELFLSFDAATRLLTARPMKGTRPGDADPTELLSADKDRAELAMIVDLMRNDLGRVCDFGSVRVEIPRRIERHATGPGSVLQATATVTGRLRAGLSTSDVLAATFPPGSVTGAPKLRAMQIIDELEPFARGPYCGCLGLFRDDGSFELAVAIRTAVLRGPTDAAGRLSDAELTYCVGAGIVADSDPDSEWRETLTKARALEPLFTVSDAE